MPYVSLQVSTQLFDVTDLLNKVTRYCSYPLDESNNFDLSSAAIIVAVIKFIYFISLISKVNVVNVVFIFLAVGLTEKRPTSKKQTESISNRQFTAGSFGIIVLS